MRPEFEFTVIKIFDHLEKAQQVKMKNDHDYAELISTDPIEAAISMYNMEVKAALHLIDEYQAMSDYLNQKFNGQNEDILCLCILRGKQYSDLNIVSYMHRVRLKYWKALLNNKKFMGLLTSNLRSKYQDMVNELANYEFSRYNIARIKREMMAELVDGAKDCIMELFDKLFSSQLFRLAGVGLSSLIDEKEKYVQMTLLDAPKENKASTKLLVKQLNHKVKKDILMLASDLKEKKDAS